MNTAPPEQFSIFSLPKLLQDAVWEAQISTGAPLALVATCAIAAASLACQDKVMVRRKPGLESPCHIFSFVIAESGERKSTCDRLFTKPIRDFEAHQLNLLQPILAEYKAEKMLWEAKRNAASSAIDKCIKNRDDPGELKDALTEIIKAEPPVPKVPKLIFTDASQEAILQALSNWPSGGIMSDEASMIFDGRALSNLGVLNKFWDGDPFHKDRVSTESFVIEAPRLTVSLMTQWRVLAKYFKKRGHLARDIGFLARCLICCPTSTQGTRFLQSANLPSSGLKAFQDRLSEILNAIPHPGGELPKPVTLEFSEPAQATWNSFYDYVESNLGHDGFLSDVRDSASKIAENAARLAAIFHFLEGGDGLIDEATTKKATDLSWWYLTEFKRLFGAQAEIPIEIQDAQEMEKYLLSVCHKHPHNPYIKKNTIRQSGPNQLRNTARRDAALHLLARDRRIFLVVFGKTQVVQLNPEFFPVSPPMQFQSSPSYSLPNSNQGGLAGQIYS